MSRQKKLLAVLACLLVLALVYAFWAMPRPQKAAPTAKPVPVRRPAAGAPAQSPAGETRVRLDLLNREAGRYPGYERDIFNYPRPAPPPPPKVVKAPPPPPPPPPIATEPAPVTPEVKRELARFTFLGYLEKDGVRTVFLSSGGEIFVVKNGETFGEHDQFHVAGMTPEVLTIRYDEDPRVINVPLVEQAPLVPSAAGPGGSPSVLPRAGFSTPESPPGGAFEHPEEAPVEEEETLPPETEGGNELPPSLENHQAGEEGMRENEMLPPGGAANE